MGQNLIDNEKELTYEKSMFRPNTTGYHNRNVNEKSRACCIVIPFGSFGFLPPNQVINICREDVKSWNFDEIIIEEEDYKWLIAKSNKLKILASLDEKE